MLNQRVKSGILGDDMEIGTRLFCCQLADVISDMKIQDIFPIASNFNIHRITAEFLNTSNQVIGEFCLVFSHENNNLEGVLRKDFHIFWLNIFQIN